MTSIENNQLSQMQNQLGQALTSCGNPGDVLRLLDEFRQRHQQVPNTGNMATAMHRIASTGSQEAVDRERVIHDKRFQQLVVCVETNLKNAPESFGEQHLANVVWGAAKLRLQREPLFNFVQREVLNPRRQLDKFSPQQLAAIAWSYAMVNFQAPELFEAVQEEAMRKPPLAEMLSKAGLLRGGSALGAFGRGRGAGGGGANATRPNTGSANNQAMGGMGNQTPAHMQAMGGGVGNNNGASAMSYQGNHAGGGPMQQRAQQAGQQAYGTQAPPNNKGGQGAYGQQGNVQQQSGYNQQYGAGNGQDSSKGSEVARAAEEHKKEMEEKQRQVIGACEEGGELCPLCVEEMDATDMALIPCPCGYQICLLCLNKIRNEGNKQCPACRSEYEEDKFRKVDLPPKKKKGDESQTADAGWENTGAKKKASNKKPPVPLTFPGFSPKVADMLAQCHEAGIVSKGELDERIMEDLKVLPERGAIAVLSEFMKKDMTRIRNKSAFVNGIIDRVQKELAHDKSGAGLAGAGSNNMGWQGQQHQHNQNINYNGPAGGMGEQRPRGLSDDDQRPGPPLGAQGGMLAPQQHAQQHSKATVGRPPQQAGIIGGGVRTGAVGMGSLGWSGAGDDDLDQMQNGLLGLGLGGCDKMGGGASGQQSFVSGLPHEDQSAVEVERARQQVEQFLMSRAGGLNASQQKQQLQQQFSGGMNHGGYQPMGGGTGNMGFPSIGAPDAGSLGSLGGVSQPGAMHGAGARGIGFGRAPGPIGGPLHGRQSDEQARAGAEAGSRLLEYITRGANGAVGEEPKSRLPLFQRMNGGHAAHQSISPLSHEGDADGWNTEIEPRALAVKSSWEDDDDANIDRCFQCGRDGRGDLDQTDGQFYCNDCWGAFEVWRSSQPMNAGRLQARRGGGADIPA